MRIIDRDRR